MNYQSSSHQQKLILIIDDNNDFCRLIQTLLNNASFLTDIATNGYQALEKVKKHTPDLIILDALMDEIDGFETCLLLREIPELADIPIIMSTGLEDTNSINRAFKSGATDFVTKPINYHIFIPRLNFMLKAEENLNELKNNKFQLMEAHRIAHMGYWVWDVKYNTFNISEQLAEICKINLKTFNSTLEGFIALIEPEDQAMVQRLILEIPSKTNYQQIEYRIKTPQDETIFVQQGMNKIIEGGNFTMTGTVQDISQRKESEKQIHHLAYFDQLTGLASRSNYQEHIQIAIKEAQNNQEKFALLYIDLDGFKHINDSLGHHMGDKLLKIIAQRIESTIKTSDFAARLGGDEFCILLNNINDSLVSDIAQRCLDKINEPLYLNNHRINPRASIGISMFPNDADNEIDLLKAADTAMYATKKTGKQCYSFYSQEMAIEAISRLENEQMLQEAFEKNQFILYYQPQVSMLTGRMISMEALVRWEHPEKGLIPPGNFIPDIERLGLIVELGNWVINTACEQIKQWHDDGLPFIQVAVNLSAVHFKDINLIDTIQNTLTRTQVPAKYLELEVTESAIQGNECIPLMNKLKQLGMKISIDDFGTGYSCLASLNKLPLDCLKIDKIFVDEINNQSNTPILLGTIISLANALNYQLIVEGVETKKQAMIMHGLGCHIIQGYFFSRPVPSDKIPALMDFNFTQLLEAN